jgi:hypothetical protein
VHEKERVAMRPHELEAAEMSYKSVLELNLPAHYQDTGDVASGSERAWGDYKFVAGAKYSVDPEKVLHVTNYGPGTNSADLRAVFDPITKVRCAGLHFHFSYQIIYRSFSRCPLSLYSLL